MLNLNKNICLVLNSNWQPIAIRNVRDSICDLMSENYDAIDVSYDENGDLSTMMPTNWEDWKNLEIREGDYSISSPSITVRVPTILVAKSFSRMTYKSIKLSNDNIRKRDNNICQYTGKRLLYNEGSIDHIIPKSRGGKDTWDNLVLCEKKLNTKKGNKTPEEAGLELINQPVKPKIKPFSAEIEKKQHKDWSHFMI